MEVRLRLNTEFLFKEKEFNQNYSLEDTAVN